MTAMHFSSVNRTSPSAKVTSSGWAVCLPTPRIVEALAYQTTVVSPVLDAEPGVNEKCGSSSNVTLA